MPRLRVGKAAGEVTSSKRCNVQGNEEVGAGIYSSCWANEDTVMGGCSIHVCACFSRKLWVVLLKKKSDVDARLKEWKALVENESGEVLGKFRTDICSIALLTWVREKAVMHETAPPRSPQSTPVPSTLAESLDDLEGSGISS